MYTVYLARKEQCLTFDLIYYTITRLFLFVHSNSGLLNCNFLISCIGLCIAHSQSSTMMIVLDVKLNCTLIVWSIENARHCSGHEEHNKRDDGVKFGTTIEKNDFFNKKKYLRNIELNLSQKKRRKKMIDSEKIENRLTFFGDAIFLLYCKYLRNLIEIVLK